MSTNKHERIEDAWKETLVSNGVDPSTADRITTAVQSHPATAFGPSSETDLRDIVTDQIKQLDLDEYGVSDVANVRLELLDLLEESLDESSKYHPPVALKGGSSPSEWPANEGIGHPEKPETQRNQNGVVISGSVDTGVDTAEMVADPETIAGFQGAMSNMSDNDGDGGESFPSGLERSPEDEPQPTTHAKTSPESPERNRAEASGQDKTRTREKPEPQQQEIDLSEKVARIVFYHSEGKLANHLPVPTNEVKGPMVYYGVEVANLYAMLLQDVLFEGYSDAEQEIFFNQLIKQRMDELLEDLDDE